MGFAGNLRELRLGQFLSQAELARRAGVHALTITRLEAGATEAGATAPATRTVRALADALGVEPRELATPREVAELRRVLGEPGQSDGKVSNRLDSWDDDGGAAQPEAIGRADWVRSQRSQSARGDRARRAERKRPAEDSSRRPSGGLTRASESSQSFAPARASND